MCRQVGLPDLTEQKTRLDKAEVKDAIKVQHLQSLKNNMKGQKLETMKRTDMIERLHYTNGTLFGNAEGVSWWMECLGRSQGTPFTMIPPRLFHIMSFFRHPGLVKRDFFQPMDWLMSIMVNICPSLDKHCIVRVKQGQGNQCRTPGVKFEDKLEEMGK